MPCFVLFPNRWDHHWAVLGGLAVLLEEVSWSRAQMSCFCKSEVPKVCVLDLYHWLVECVSTRGLAGQLLAHALNWMQPDSCSPLLWNGDPSFSSHALVRSFSVNSDFSHSHGLSHPGCHVLETQVLPFLLLSGLCFSLDSSLPPDTPQCDRLPLMLPQVFHLPSRVCGCTRLTPLCSTEKFQPHPRMAVIPYLHLHP